MNKVAALITLKYLLLKTAALMRLHYLEDLLAFIRDYWLVLNQILK